MCNGCSHVNAIEERNQGVEAKCPFCREITLSTDKENDKRALARVEANNPMALEKLGDKYSDEHDYKTAFECFTKAAEADNVNVQYWDGCTPKGNLLRRIMINAFLTGKLLQLVDTMKRDSILDFVSGR